MKYYRKKRRERDIDNIYRISISPYDGQPKFCHYHSESGDWVPFLTEKYFQDTQIKNYKKISESELEEIIFLDSL